MLFAPFLFNDKADAVSMFETLGARYDERLDLVADHPEVGIVHRYFAIMGNALKVRPLNPCLTNRLIRLVDDPDNERVKVKLEAGWLDFTPSNKPLLRRVAPVLNEMGVHLPWSFNAMNIELADKMQGIDGDPIPFDVFYGRFATFSHGQWGPDVELGRLFSTVIDAAAGSTWLEPIHDNFLDEDVGIVIEANTR